jgi:hypothetical protein
MATCVQTYVASPRGYFEKYFTIKGFCRRIERASSELRGVWRGAERFCSTNLERANPEMQNPPLGRACGNASIPGSSNHSLNRRQCQ